MAKSKNKNSISLYIKKLNEIDVNTLIASLNNINLSDLKKINIKELTGKIKNSYFFKPTVGILSASASKLVSILLARSEKMSSLPPENSENQPKE